MVFHGRDEWCIHGYELLLTDVCCLQDVGEDVVGFFQSDRESDDGVAHIHFASAFGRERSEDSARGVDSKRAVVKEVRRAFDKLQAVDELEACLLTL